MSLRVEGISVAFGGLKALEDVTFSQPENSIYGIIGPNGAGKTTLLNTITGVYRPTAGEVWCGDQRLTGRELHEITTLGIARTFQHIELFGELTVLENLLLAKHLYLRPTLLTAVFPTVKVREREALARTEALEILDEIGLIEYRDRPAVSLPFAFQRLLEVGRAVMLRPRFILLDEPAAGMTSEEILRLSEFIRSLRDKHGIAITLVAHTLRMVMSLCDHIIVLDRGRLLASGTPTEIQTNKAVIDAYLGKAQRE